MNALGPLPDGEASPPFFFFANCFFAEMPDTDLPRFLDAKQFAEEIGFHRETLYRMLKGGDIPGAKKIGGRWRIPRWALEEIGTPGHLANA